MHDPGVHRSAVLAVLAVLLALAACGDSADPDADAPPATPTVTLAADGCPATLPVGEPVPWVPAPPTTETPGRLAPDADPVEALVCRYEDVSGTPAGSASLVGERVVTAGLDRVRHDLLLPARVPGGTRACTAMGGPVEPHLVRFSYADGELWLAATRDPNSCQDSGNGAFTTSAYLGDVLQESYDASTWTSPPAPAAGSCSSSGSGRAGQERTLVPPGWASMTVCRPPAKDQPPPAREVDRATAERVVALLAQVATAPGSGGCSGPSRTTYDLLVTYPAGPAVQVRYAPGCEPPVRNGSLDATPSAAQGTELEDLLRPR